LYCNIAPKHVDFLLGTKLLFTATMPVSTHIDYDFPLNGECRERERERERER
jgi:hypothetical protein